MWWHTVTHGRGSEGGNWRMEWIASTLHTTSEHRVSSIITADAHTSAASSRLNWRPRRFKWTRPSCRKTKSGFCACAITFQTQSIHKYARVKHVICSKRGSKCFSEILIQKGNVTRCWYRWRRSLRPGSPRTLDDGSAGSNPASGMDVCLLRVPCVGR
jgi:hypothetical protein